MASEALAIPILPGKTESVRKMFREISGPRRQEFDQSEKRSGITREADFIQTSPMGDTLILYIEADDLRRAFSEFSVSTYLFDVWVKKEFKDATGLDFTQPPSGPLPEQVMDYKA